MLTLRTSRGSIDDFDRLVELGVEIEGKIALIKYGGLFRGLKVKNAQDHGAIGAVIFLDPGDDGNMTVAKGVEAYPGTNILPALEVTTLTSNSRRSCQKPRRCSKGLYALPFDSNRRSHNTGIPLQGGLPSS